MGLELMANIHDLLHELRQTQEGFLEYVEKRGVALGYPIDEERLVPLNAPLTNAFKSGFVDALIWVKQVAETLKQNDSSDCWRPIETAPKDETVVDIATTFGRIVNVHFDSTKNKYVSLSGHIIGSDVTHWMPTPKLPTVPVNQHEPEPINW